MENGNTLWTDTPFEVGITQLIALFTCLESKGVVILCGCLAVMKFAAVFVGYCLADTCAFKVSDDSRRLYFLFFYVRIFNILLLGS